MGGFAAPEGTPRVTVIAAESLIRLQLRRRPIAVSVISVAAAQIDLAAVFTGFLPFLPTSTDARQGP